MNLGQFREQTAKLPDNFDLTMADLRPVTLVAVFESEQRVIVSDPDSEEEGV